MDNNSIKETKEAARAVLLFLLLILIISVAGNLYLNWKLHLLAKEADIELKEARESSEKAYKDYMIKQEYYNKLDSQLNSSLSARIHNTYITNIIKNEKSKKDIIGMDSSTTDSLFSIDFAWAKERYKYLFN